MKKNYYQKIEEIKYINYQINTSIVSAIIIIISIILLYNEKNYLKKGEYIISPNKSRKLSIFNRLLATVIAIIFLYINYKLYEISKKEGEDLKSYKLQIDASILTVIASIIVLYVAYTSTSETIPDVENPII